MIRKKKTDLELIEEDIKTMQNNVLALSEDKINRFIERIYASGNNIKWINFYDFVPSVDQEQMDSLIVKHYSSVTNIELKTVYLFAILLQLTEERKQYHLQLQEKSYDRKNLQLFVIFLGIIALLSGLLYYLYIHYEVTKKDELSKIIEALKQFGVTVKQYSKRRYKSSDYFIEFISTKKLPLYQHPIVEKLVDQAYEVHSAIYGWIKMVWICGGASLFLAVQAAFFYMRKGLRPRHKACYARYCLIERKIHEVLYNVYEKVEDV